MKRKSYVLNVVLVIADVFDEDFFAWCFRTEDAHHQHSVSCRKNKDSSVTVERHSCARTTIACVDIERGLLIAIGARQAFALGSHSASVDSGVAGIS